MSLMNARFLALATVVLPALLVAEVSGAAPPVSVAPAPAPQQPVQARPALKVKKSTQLTTTKVLAVPGEKKNFEAILKSGDVPLAGKSVVFKIESTAEMKVPGGSILVGNDTTDGNGKATVAFSLPELNQGVYNIKASYAGDDETQSTADDANLSMFKAVIKIELGDLMWGTYKNEPGSPTGSISLRIIRTSDGKMLTKDSKITVNNHSWALPGAGSIVPLPTDATKWKVKVDFEGDNANLAASASRSYQKPN